MVVADAGMNKIVVFGENGTLLRTWLGVLQTKPYGVVMVTTRIVAVTQVDHNEVICIDIESGVSWVALTLPGSETGHVCKYL